MIDCRICGKQLVSIKALAGHIRYNHLNYDTQKYYDEFYKKENEGICKLEGCNNQTTFCSFGKGYSEHCCQSHSQLDPEIRNKLENTREDRYGDRKFTNRAKARETTKEIYGDEFYNNRPKCSESLLNRSTDEKEDWRSKLRMKWDKKSKEELENIDIQRKNTLKEKYGDESYPARAAQETVKQKYGVENISQIPGYKEKVKIVWDNKTEEEMASRLEKTKNTMMERYGVDHNMHSEEMKQNIIQKARQTKIETGKWLSDDQIPEFKLYIRNVYYFTRISVKEKFSLDELSETGRCGVEGALQVDHMFSIKEGFLNNVSPKLIGHKNNLRLISWEDNDTKKSNSSITLQELFEMTKL